MTEHAAEFGDDKHPYGAGSHGLLLDPAEMPGCYPVKGNVRDDGVLYYHRPDSRSYGATRPEVWFDSPSAAEAAGFSLAPTHPKGSSGDGFEPGGAEHPCSAEDVETNRMVARGGSLVHPYGAGSHGLLLDPAEMPGCYPVKGNVRDDGVLYYHRPDSRSYGATRPEVWFDSPSAAEAAGFSLAPTHPKGSSGDGFEPGGAEHPCSAEDVETNRLQAIEAVAGVEDSDTSGADTASGPSADGVVIAGGTGLAAAALGLAAFKADRHPYGVGSLVGDVDAVDYPDFYPVKGNVRIDGTSSYHRPDAQDYRAAPADVWFDSPSAAEAAGFELAPSHPDGVTGDDFEPGGSGHRWSVAEVEEERSRALYGPGWKPSTAMGQDEVSDTDAEADDVEVDVDKTAEVPADQVHTLVSGLPGVDDDSVEGDQAKSGADDSEEGSGVTGAVLAAGAGLGGAEVLGRTVGSDGADSDGADSDGADSDGADSDGGNLESEVPEAIGGGIPRIGDLESSTEASVPDLQDDDDETDPASLDLGDVGAVAGGATVVAGGAALLGKALSGDDDLDADAEGVIEMTGDGDAAAGVDINAVKGTADTAKAGKAKAGTAKSKAKKAGAAKADKVKGKAGAAKADATKAAKGGTAKGKELVGAGAGVASRSASPGVGRTRNVAGSGPGGSGGKGLAGGSLGGLADRTGLGRWLWIGLAVLGFLLLALLLSRCGSDSTETSGAATDGPATDGAANAGDDGAADADEPASPTTIEASSAGELRTQALAALGAAGFGDVDVEMDGDNMRLVGNVGSAEDVAAAEAALADLEGMGGLENALVVGDASAAASEDDAAEADAAAEDDAAEADAADGGAAEADAAAGDGAAADSGPAAGEDDEADSGSGAAADDSDDDSDDEDEPETPAAEPVDGDPSYTG